MLLRDSLTIKQTFENENHVHDTLKKIHQIQGAIEGIRWATDDNGGYIGDLIKEAEDFPLPPPS